MTAPRDHDSRRLDVAAFAAAASALEGVWPAERLPRWTASTLAPESGARADIAWRAQGSRLPLPGAGVQPALTLGADTEATLACQRCLQPMTVPVRASRRLFFIAGEDAAAALDAESEDDVLALAPALDLAALVEDELLLSLPLVPRHDVCPEPLPRSFGAEESGAAVAENPFAVLAALKRGPPPS